MERELEVSDLVEGDIIYLLDEEGAEDVGFIRKSDEGELRYSGACWPGKGRDGRNDVPISHLECWAEIGGLHRIGSGMYCDGGAKFELAENILISLSSALKCEPNLESITKKINSLGSIGPWTRTYLPGHVEGTTMLAMIDQYTGQTVTWPWLDYHMNCMRDRILELEENLRWMTTDRDESKSRITELESENTSLRQQIANVKNELRETYRVLGVDP